MGQYVNKYTNAGFWKIPNWHSYIKWNKHQIDSKKIDKIQQVLKQKYRDVKVIGFDSSMWTLTAKDFLLGGLLTIIKGKYKVILQED